MFIVSKHIQFGEFNIVFTTISWIAAASSYNYFLFSSSSAVGLGGSNLNGIGISSTAGSCSTNMYRPNFTQAFQRAGPYPLFPGASSFPSSGASLLTNGEYIFPLEIQIFRNYTGWIQIRLYLEASFSENHI